MKRNERMILYAVVLICLAILGTSIFYVVRRDAKESQQAPTEISKNQDRDTDRDADRDEIPATDGSMPEEALADGQMTETTLLFTGDVLFANSFANCYNRGGIEAVVSQDMLNAMTQADITMVNEEFPFSSRGTKMEDKQYTFRADPSYVKALTEMGVDIVSLANNHILDYGKEALSDTFATLDAEGILYAGAGDSLERAKEVQLIEKNGKTFGFLAASRVIPVVDWNIENGAPGVLATYDETRLVEAIEEARDQCDVLVVFVHWGVEHQSMPEAYQRSLAQSYVDAGADLVIGAHTHCLQGIEFINGKPVFYSLGNFIFGTDISQTMAVQVTVEEDNTLTCRLVGATASGGQTKVMSDVQQRQLNSYVQGISSGVTVEADGTVREQ
ncbi:MAG: CapA family protein [Lachnospiraceae bacterium]|nr:CapA family protein [Lachnospiraceae bacterium]